MWHKKSKSNSILKTKKWLVLVFPVFYVLVTKFDLEPKVGQDCEITKTKLRVVYTRVSDFANHHESHKWKAYCQIYAVSTTGSKMVSPRQGSSSPFDRVASSNTTIYARYHCAGVAVCTKSLLAGSRTLLQHSRYPRVSRPSLLLALAR